MTDTTVPRIPSGFMELLPSDQIVFNSLLDTIRKSYQLHGFLPIETPALEYSDVLLAKAGGETEKQIYRFTRGDNELCLHFDLTVPLARYVAQYRNYLMMPFRRYQIQKVWRAERPQKGRYREFYQCDIDIIGSYSPLYDAEIVSVIYATFQNMGFDAFTVRINNRKILNGFLANFSLESQATEVLRIIDKLEKQGREYVSSALSDLGIADEIIVRILDFINISGSNTEIIQKLNALGIENEEFKNGVEELTVVDKAISNFGVPKSNYKIDLKIARGLDYYTGTVYETTLDEFPEIGSVCSGGRFDKLTQYYTDEDLPGVGVSIGLTRLYSQLKQNNILDLSQPSISKVLVAIQDQDSKCLDWAIAVTREFRSKGINTEIYLGAEAIGKQIKYANKLSIPFVAIIGGSETTDKTITLKNMLKGEQTTITLEESLDFLRE